MHVSSEPHQLLVTLKVPHGMVGGGKRERYIPPMRTLVMSALLALASVGCTEKSNQEHQGEQAKLPEMSVDEVAAGLESKQLTVVDCNGEKNRKKHGILPGAILVADEETFPASALPTDKAAKLVFYCGGPG